MVASDNECDRQLEAEVTGLAALDLAALRTLWRGKFGEPPKLRSVELLRHMLAWRIQAARLGGLDKEVVQALKRHAKTQASAQRRLNVGARIGREYRGVMHEVEVLEDGYRYRDRIHPNLSVIAREITGTRWNGWRFFGRAGVAA
jgi:hypothetical protein